MQQKANMSWLVEISDVYLCFLVFNFTKLNYCANNEHVLKIAKKKQNDVPKPVTRSYQMVFLIVVC